MAWNRLTPLLLLVAASCLGSNPPAGEPGAELLLHQDLGRTQVDPLVPGVLTITFDDGPGPYTRHVVDVLDKHGAPGVFFLVGRRIPGNRDTLDYIRERGHQLANHSYNHEIQPTLSQSAFKDYASAVMTNIAGLDDGRLFFRFPYGSADPDQVRWISEVGSGGKTYKHVGWHMDSQDFDFNRTYPASMFSKQVVAEDEECEGQANPFSTDFVGWSVFTARQTGGGIMLFHDTTRITNDNLDAILTAFDDPASYWASLAPEKADLYRRYYVCRKADPMLPFTYRRLHDGAYPTFAD